MPKGIADLLVVSKSIADLLTMNFGLVFNIYTCKDLIWHEKTDIGNYEL